MLQLSGALLIQRLNVSHLQPKEMSRAEASGDMVAIRGRVGIEIIHLRCKNNVLFSVASCQLPP